MIRILFVRHAQSTANVLRVMDATVPGPDLTEVGREQARALVKSLADVPMTRIYASTVVRTQQTAAPLAEARDLPVHVLGGLREIEAGDLEQRSDHPSILRYVETVMRWARGGPDDLAERIPGGPDGHAFFLRFDTAIAQIERELREEADARDDDVATAVVISHGAAIRVWVANRCTNIPNTYGADHELYNTGTVRVEKAPGGTWQMIAWTVGDPGSGDAATHISFKGASDATGETLAEVEREK